MATEDPMTKVNEIIKCVICWDFLLDPRQLDCQHVFCYECIDTHFETNGKNCAPCPCCRRLYWPKDRNTKNLPKSLLIRQISDIQRTTDRDCEAESCDNNKAPFLCLTCRRWLCASCKMLTCIVENGVNIDHNAFIKSDIDPGLFDIVKRSRHNRCYTHPSHEVEKYCRQCRMLICKLCQTNNHLHHKLEDIPKQTRESREELEEIVTSLQRKQQQHKLDLKMYTDLQTVVNVELFNAGDCQKMMTMCSRDIDNCDKIIQLITQLLKFGSDVVVISTYLNLEERIQTELGQCHSLVPLLTELNSRLTDVDHTTATWVDACRGERSHKISDSGVDDLSISLEEEIPFEGQSCEVLNCVSQTLTKHLCLTCMKWVCKVCSKRFCKNASRHEVFPVAGMDKHLYDVVMGNRRNFSCKLHPDNDVTMFCSRCNMPLCTTCQVNDHLDHQTIKISDRAKTCGRKLKSCKEKLQQQVKSYEATRYKFLEMQNSPCAEAFNPSYCENFTSRCDSGIERCENFVKRITFLLRYGTSAVVVDEFPELKFQIEDELRICPSDFTRPLRQLVSFLNDALDHSCIDDAATSGDEAGYNSNNDEGILRVSVTNLEEGGASATSGVSGSGSNHSTSAEVTSQEFNERTPLVSGQQNNSSVRRRVVASVRNAASEMPNNPNSSEESNARGHVGYGLWFWEQIKALFRYLSRFLSGA